jgi:ribosomal protein S12 methylthiotransferase accessory factor
VALTGPPAAMSADGGLAGLERHEAPSSAVERLRAWARLRGLGFDLDVLWAGARLGTGAVPLITQVRLHANGSVLGEGTGKGLGVQSLASGMYEALEDFAAFTANGGGPERYGNPVSEASSGVTFVAASALPSPLVEHDALFRLIHSSDARPIPAIRMTEVARLLGPPGGGTGTGTVLWPAALLDLTYVPPEDSPGERLVYRYCSTNGIASGVTAAEAILHGLNEINERDALGAFLLDVVRQEPHGESIVLDDEPETSLLTCIEDSFGTDVQIRRLRSVWGHAVMALSRAVDSRGCAILGSGASWSLRYAVERALLELAQNLVAENHDPPHADGMLDSLDRLRPFSNLLAAARLRWVPPTVGTVAPGAPVSAGVVDQLWGALRDLHAAGFTSYARPLLRTSRQPRAPQVWQVAIPGFERFHLVRAGLPVEPTGRLRTPSTVSLARERGSRHVPDRCSG